MDLQTAIKGMLDAEKALRTPEGVANPVVMSENMQRLAQYTGAVEEHLAKMERDHEYLYQATILNKMQSMPVTRAEKETAAATADLKAEIKYLTRLTGSAWKQVGVIQSRINHLKTEAGTTL